MIDTVCGRALYSSSPPTLPSAMSYAVTGSYKKESDYFICLHLATIGMYDRLFNVQLAKQLDCKAVDKDMLKEYKKIGISIDKVDRINLSYLNYNK